jgi:hypothetical protein
MPRAVGTAGAGETICDLVELRRASSAWNFSLAAAFDRCEESKIKRPFSMNMGLLVNITSRIEPGPDPFA